MTLKIYSIYDAKSEVFNTPFFNKSHGEAERNFQDLVNDEKSTVNRYPDDFSLYYIGEYDDSNGKLKTLPEPEQLIKAIQLLKKPTFGQGAQTQV